MKSTRKNEFEFLPLHDAVLKSVRLEWAEKLCVLEFSAFIEQLDKIASCRLTFHEVREFHMSCMEPWGPSSSINGGVVDDGRYQIEMQSGDVIKVQAQSFSFVAI